MSRVSRCNMNMPVDVERRRRNSASTIDFSTSKNQTNSARNNASSHFEVVRETDGSGRCSYARRRPNTDGNCRTPTINPPRSYAAFLKFNIDREWYNGTMKMRFPMIDVSKILFEFISQNYVIRNIVS